MKEIGGRCGQTPDDGLGSGRNAKGLSVATVLFPTSLAVCWETTAAIAETNLDGRKGKAEKGCGETRQTACGIGRRRWKGASRI